MELFLELELELKNTITTTKHKRIPQRNLQNKELASSITRLVDIEKPATKKKTLALPSPLDLRFRYQPESCYLFSSKDMSTYK